MEIPILNDILVIFGLAILVLYIFKRLRIPPIVGYLLTGAVAGPYGFALVTGVHEVEIMAEIGVVLLLFSIGMEFSLKHLLEIKRSVLLGGATQVSLTFAGGLALALLFGLSMPESIFFGFLISLSSTAIVLKLMQEKSVLDAPHGRTSLAILIFQDIIVVPMMIMTPLLRGGDLLKIDTFGLLLVKALALMIFVYVAAKFLVPKLLYLITKTRSRELFLMSIGFIAFAVAWLSGKLGLSLALGAFLAGLIISESEYSHHAVSNILPFRDIFMSLFFVSVGMLLDFRTITANPGMIISMVAIIVLLKMATAGFAAYVLRYPLRTAILVALALFQVGEFSFILSEIGTHYALITPERYQMFLAIAVITMMITPFIFSLGMHVDKLLRKLPLPKKLKFGNVEGGALRHAKSLNNHLVIIGFGVNGRNLAKAAKAASIPYVVLELNPETVQQETDEPIIFGDGIYEDVLEHLGVERARVLVVAISDASSTRQITLMARQLNPKLHIIVRTRYLAETNPLLELGASEVIPEEFETSVEIFSRVLRTFLVEDEKINSLVREIRSGTYEMLRSNRRNDASIIDLKIPEVEVCNLHLNEASPLAGKTLAELNLRHEYGVTILAVLRDDVVVSNPGPATRLEAKDRLLVFGRSEALANFSRTAAKPATKSSTSEVDELPASDSGRPAN